MRDWFSRQSWPAVFGFYAVAMTVAFGLTALLLERTTVYVALLSGVVAGVLFATVMTVFVVYTRRRANATGQPRVLVGSAIRSGVLPDPVDPSAWLAALAQRTKSDQSLRRLGIVLFAIAVAFVLLNIGNRDWVGVLVLATVVVALGVWRSIGAHLELPKIAKLDAAIREEYDIDPVVVPEPTAE
jgi:hypothetical protein